VRESGADVALLQEVDRRTERSGRIDQVAELERLTGMGGAFGRTLDYQGGEYGIAILSRWPVVRDTLVHLVVSPPQQRAGGSYEPRGALVTVIARGTDTLRVLNTHLDPSRDDRYRAQEVADLIGLVERARAGCVPAASSGRANGCGTVLAGGDFNSTPESAVQQRLRAAGWRDAWEQCGSGDGLTYPTELPVKRIDYLFIVGGAHCRSARVLDADASDHRAVLFVLGR
jgi:endonuclease/exonuclease/phosphatase family metal-dependent hydrolase